MKNNMMRFLFIITATITGSIAFAQQPDSTKPVHHYLPDVTVVGHNSPKDLHQLPEIVGTSIYAGKKNALVVLDNVQGNVVTNTMRQVMAKVPGIHVWESDGSGIQIGIAARGLSPNRSWEFNVRQNGYDIAADPFGYPEAYYNPQLQAVQRIEVVRGQGALQYGPQFGGLVNYILRNGSQLQKPVVGEAHITGGSNGLFNGYAAVGGQTKKFHYYSFFDHRQADGWRNNSRYATNAGFGTFTWKVNSRFSITGEVMRSHIASQQPGGLTDAQVKQDARQSFRRRNWMDIGWTTAALIANYQFNQQSKLNVKLFGMAGDRGSVGYLRAINLPDSINPATGTYSNRVVDIDYYRNLGMETRYLGHYRWAGMNNTLSAGMRLYTGGTQRYRDGKGTIGDDNTMERVDAIWPRDIQFRSHNAAVFAENIFRISERFIVIPGIRYEYLWAKASGRNGFTSSGSEILLQNQQRGRGFLLAGVGAEWHGSKDREWYANISQAYRPIQFADLTTPPTTDEVDPALKDSKGYNIDLGYRGKLHSFLSFDVSAFYLRYNNRIGSITRQRTDGSFYNYRTNVGNSNSHGVEAFAEWNALKTFSNKPSKTGLSIFISYSYLNARYGNLELVTRSGSNLIKTNLKNNRVENAPEHIVRSGLKFDYKKFSASVQVSHVAKTYADANNTVTASTNGQNGLIPAYTVGDFTAGYRFSSVIEIKTGINNITDARYFTRRAGGYPGPGALPADGRSFFAKVGVRF
jgi:Fe(3+) dicitrate transport protein